MDSFFEKDENINEIKYFSINQDYNCIAIGTKIGFKIYSTDPFQLFYESKCGPISIVEMLHTTNLILLVGLNDFGDFSPRKVTIWSTSTNSVLCSSWPFTNKISMAKLNKKRMIVNEKNFLHIYITGEMKIIHTLDIGTAALGKLVLSPTSDNNNFVCYSCSKEEGVVKIYDLNYLTYKSAIKAHKSPISKLSINSRGDLLATCSSKGTIIRVFSLPKGDKLFTYKRGLSNAFIYNINFSRDSDKLITSSETGTLHVFDLKLEQGESQEQKDKQSGISSYMTNFLSNITSKFLPKDYEDYIGVTRSIISFNSNCLKADNIVSFNPQNIAEAFCFTADGSFYLFSINYETQSFTKLYEWNIKNLRLII